MLPNVRKQYIPDPGYTMFDIDLASADLRIVAWESNCRLLKEWLYEEDNEGGPGAYCMVAREYYHDPSIGKKDTRRQRFKSLCHATHYLGLAKNIASNANIGLGVAEVERIQEWYLKLCPEIGEWHESIKSGIDKQKTVKNAFGYEFHFLGRLDSHSYNEGAAWIPQSTVGIIINHALVNISNNLPDVQPLLQVHDSLTGQYPTDMPSLRESILQESRIVVPYSDPLIIPTGIKTSTRSWGHCQ